MRIWRNALLAIAFLGVLILPIEVQQEAAQPLAGAPSYEQVMNQLSQTFLDKRHAVMDGIRAQEQAQSRQAWVGATVVKLLGGLPGNHDPDAAFRGQFDRVFRAHQALGWHGRLFIPPALPIELLIVLPGK